MPVPVKARCEVVVGEDDEEPVAEAVVVCEDVVSTLETLSVAVLVLDPVLVFVLVLELAGVIPAKLSTVESVWVLVLVLVPVPNSAASTLSNAASAFFIFPSLALQASRENNPQNTRILVRIYAPLKRSFALKISRIFK